MCSMKSEETRAASDVETELIVAEVDERRPVRRASGSHADDAVAKNDAYRALLQQLDQLPQDGELLSSTLQGSCQLCSIYTALQCFHVAGILNAVKNIGSTYQPRFYGARQISF